jgi:hypothetical protein
VFDVQEITPYILSIFESFAWWKEYQSSPVSIEEQNEKNFCMMVFSHTLVHDFSTDLLVANHSITELNVFTFVTRLHS